MSLDISNILPGVNTLETSRLYLKEITPELWNYAFSNLSDLQLIELLALGDMKRLETEKEKYHKGMTTHSISFRLFLLMERRSGKTIGKAGFHTWHAIHRRAELGYAIDLDAYKNQGYMSEALAPVLKYGFEKMNLHRIEAFLSLANTPSVKLVEKFGFTKEGLLREHYFKNNVHEDSACYSLLRREYYENGADDSLSI